jgi:quinol-cytochrome oxidoreductase complex cytochrome b subunit
LNPALIVLIVIAVVLVVAFIVLTILGKKAQKRVKDIRTYYYMVLGYLAVGYIIVSRN